MPPIESLAVLGLCGLIGLGLVALVFAWSWKGWLQLRHHQLDAGAAGPGRARDLPAVTNRIDLADLRERIKKLEAIAAGVEF